MKKRLVLLALTLGVLFLQDPPSAEARRCGHNQIRRVSMGICVSTRSHLAYGYVRARRSIRYGHRYRHVFPRTRVASRSWQEEEDQADERERRAKPKPPPVLARHRPKMLRVIEPEPEAPPAPVEDPEVEVPYVIQGSSMMRTPLKTFDWIKP